MRTHRHMYAAALIALGAGTSACTEQRASAPDEPQLLIYRTGTVALSPATDSVAIGSTRQLTATANGRRGNAISGAVFTWTSATPAVATVSSSGLVTGVAAGTAVISAARNGVSASATMKVTGSVVPPVVPPVGTTGRWVSGYYAGYQRNLYPEAQIDFSIMTHIIVVGIEPTANGGVSTDFFIDNTNGPIMAKAISSRAHAAGRKAILMLGGAGYRDALAAATTPANMPTFVNNLINTMTTLGYDGIDVDWEPIPSVDEPVAIDLLKRLRAARPGIILTFPVGWTGPVTPFYVTVAGLVDQMNIMSYGMSGNWGGWDSWHDAALFGETSSHPSSISAAVKLYQNVGIPNSKIGVGIGAAGSCWKNVSTMGVSLAAGQDVIANDNVMSYVNIVTQYYSASAYRWDAVAKAGYLSLPTATGPAGCNLVSYEDPQAVTERGNYVTSAGLGGAIVWTVNQAYFPGAAVGSRDPLLKAAYTSIVP